MKELNCRRVCQLIEEAELDRRPDAEIAEHLNSCRSCEQFYRERSKLREMISDLQVVEAPADFHFRLRARLMNERSSFHHPWFSGFNLGSAALTTLAILLLAAVAYRSFLMKPTTPTLTNNSSNVTTHAPDKIETGSEVASSESRLVSKDPNNVIQAVSSAESQPRRTLKRRPGRENVQTRNFVAGGSRFASKDFSATAANVIRPDDRMIGDGSPAFPIDATNQYMKLSLDDNSGAIRHISLPRVSFGSQRVLAGETTSMVRATSRGDW